MELPSWRAEPKPESRRGPPSPIGYGAAAFSALLRARRRLVRATGLKFKSSRDSALKMKAINQKGRFWDKTFWGRIDNQAAADQRRCLLSRHSRREARQIRANHTDYADMPEHLYYGKANGDK